LHSITGHYATSSEAVEFCLPPGSREATLTSGKEASSNVIVHKTREGTKDGKRRHKQHPQGATTKIDYNEGDNGKPGGSDMECVMTVAHSNKRQAWPPTNHFKRLPKEACPNHMYPIRHKLKECDIMKSFIIPGSLTWGAALDDDPGGSNKMPFCNTHFLQE
jgi:hypothetical protein